MRKSNCDPRVKAFTDGIDPEDMYISAISIGEISYGMEKLPAGKKKHDLAIWLYSKLPEWFHMRIISLDTDVMTEWGRSRALTDRAMPAVDMMIAAAAITHHMTLVTRNIKDFEDIEGLMIINPWEF
jgi:predicted nucleic acid-binding protein